MEENVNLSGLTGLPTIAHCLPITQDAPGFRSFAFWHARLSADDIRLIYEADDFHLAAALGSGQRIYFPNLLDALPPLW